jgi:hypothetical protein
MPDVATASAQGDPGGKQGDQEGQIGVIVSSSV